jgi:hypothetical protein
MKKFWFSYPKLATGSFWHCQLDTILDAQYDKIIVGFFYPDKDEVNHYRIFMPNQLTSLMLYPSREKLRLNESVENYGIHDQQLTVSVSPDLCEVYEGNKLIMAIEGKELKRIK